MRQCAEPARQKPTERMLTTRPIGGFFQRTTRTMTLALQLDGYRLTTAEILYHLPDHPGLLQSFVWQDLDIAPKFPVLHNFLAFWQRSLDGKLHSVRVGSAKLISAGELRQVAHLQHMN
jgi:uncharacterized protein Usg